MYLKQWYKTNAQQQSLILTFEIQLLDLKDDDG
jgi:hypothetical protein